MKKWLCLCTLAVVGAQPAASQTNTSAKKQIQASYGRESMAIQRENSAGVMVHYARDYQYFGPRGEKYRAPQVQAILSQMFAAMRGLRSSVSVLSWKPSGKSMIARVRERLQGTFTDKRTKRSSLLVVVEERNDYWRPAGKTWVKWRSRSLKQRETMNGRPVRR